MKVCFEKYAPICENVYLVTSHVNRMRLDGRGSSQSVSATAQLPNVLYELLFLFVYTSYYVVKYIIYNRENYVMGETNGSRFPLK